MHRYMQYTKPDYLVERINMAYNFLFYLRSDPDWLTRPYWSGKFPTFLQNFSIPLFEPTMKLLKTKLCVSPS